MITIWQTNDRQGTKYFSARPDFVAGHDFFTGKRIDAPAPADRQHTRIIRKFTANVIGASAGPMGYPKKIKVGG